MNSIASTIPNALSVINREGAIVKFDQTKIYNAICKAFAAVGIADDIKASEYTKTVVEKLSGTVDIESIQDVVEQVLSHEDPKVAKQYILYRAERAKLREIKPKFNRPHIQPPFSSIGLVTHSRTYAQRLDAADPNSPTEQFEDTIARVCEAVETQLGCNFTRSELSDLYRYLMELKGSVAGRFLWQLGMPTINRLGLMSLQNCAFCTISNLKAFEWLFDSAMLGVGIGFSVRKSDVEQLPLVKFNVTVEHKDTNDADFIVPDSREGWVKLLRKTLRAFFVTGRSFTYSTKLIRPKGEPIKSFGGIASGPGSLIEGITRISELIAKAEGRKLTTLEAYDLVCILASVVVSGNVRRVAAIAIGDCDDLDFIRAKRWDLGIPNWRAYSNNSVYCDDISKLPEEFWLGYQGLGEPYGLININLAKKIGRLADGEKYPDPTVEGFNPCAEQALADGETCCLAELYLPNLTSYEESVKVATLLYRVCKHSLNLPCHQPITDAIVKANQRMGIGITGYCQATAEQKSWLSPLYEHLRQYDVEYSKARSFNQSVKLTTCKPSGTLSLLPGVTPGCHPAIYQYMIRRIRMDSKSPLVEICRSHGYTVEYEERFDGSKNYNTSIVEFPYKYPENAILASNTSAIDQLKIIKEIQTNWSDNSVSCTIYYSLNKLDAEAIIDDEVVKGATSTFFNQLIQDNVTDPEDIEKFALVYPAFSAKRPRTLVLPLSETKIIRDGLTPKDGQIADKSYDNTVVESLYPELKSSKTINLPSYFDVNFNKVNVVITEKYYNAKEFEDHLMKKYGSLLKQKITNLDIAEQIATYYPLLNPTDTIGEYIEIDFSRPGIVVASRRHNELDQIKAYLAEHFTNEIKTCSFLLHNEHGFKQAPYEEITKEQYDALVTKCKPITRITAHVTASELELSSDCVGGVCPVK